ncbi:hypothetical protein AB0469_17895 [Streptomyces sp. NPDC093801]
MARDASKLPLGLQFAARRTRLVDPPPLVEALLADPETEAVRLVRLPWAH